MRTIGSAQLSINGVHVATIHDVQTVTTFAPVPPFLAAQAVIVIQPGFSMAPVQTDAARQIAELPAIRYPVAKASALGWACVRELETVEARRRFQVAWCKAGSG